MKTYCITGAASGIGAACAALVREQGHRVITVDMRDADVIADLSNPEGRQAAVDGILAACDGKLDGLIPAAGVGGSVPAALTVRVNYYGVRALVDGLRPALAKGDEPAVCFISSNTAATTTRCADEDLEVFFADDEEAAVEHFKDWGLDAYPAGKQAVARWMRKSATEWMKTDGIRFNAIAPGIIETNMMKAVLDDPELSKDLKRIPLAVERWGQPEEIAAAIWFMMTNTYVIGQTLFVDGGTEIILQPNSYPHSWQREG